MFKSFSPGDIVTFETIQFVLLLAMVFASALLVYKISQTFQDRLEFSAGLHHRRVWVQSPVPVRFLDASATMHPAVTWLLGMGVSVWILYQGIPRVMLPDPTHAFGLYLSAMIVVILTSGLTRLMTAMYLLGYMDLQHSWLANRIQGLLGH